MLPGRARLIFAPGRWLSLLEICDLRPVGI